MVPPDFKEDELVENIVPDPSQLSKSPPVNIVKLEGYFGKSDKQGYWRLYVSSEFQRYFELAEEDILYRQLSDVNGIEKKTILHLKPDAKMLLIQVTTPEKIKSEAIEKVKSLAISAFMRGKITDDFLPKTKSELPTQYLDIWNFVQYTIEGSIEHIYSAGSNLARTLGYSHIDVCN